MFNLSSTALVRNKSTKSITIVTGVDNPAVFKEFIESVSKYYTPLEDEIEFKVIALIDTESDPLIQTFDGTQNMSIKNFFKSLIKVGLELVDGLSSNHPSESETMRRNIDTLTQDIKSKFNA
ncbi:hypothetical protein LIS04_48 [Listeria phage LIS04]|nr:hypothetical protein LIS04_48 [Listeria phage LIS04]